MDESLETEPDPADVVWRELESDVGGEGDDNLEVENLLPEPEEAPDKVEELADPVPEWLEAPEVA